MDGSYLFFTCFCFPSALKECQHKFWKSFSSSIFFCATAPCGPEPPHSRGLKVTHNDASQSVGFLGTSSQLVAETST